MSNREFLTREGSRVKGAATRQLTRPRTARGFNRLMNERWDKQKTRLAAYSAKELSEDYRGFFTTKTHVTAMDIHLGRHMRFELQRGYRKTAAGWIRPNYNRGVVDLRAAKKELQDKARLEKLSASERLKSDRAFRATVDKLITQGAEKKGNKLTLSFQQQRQLYRLDRSPDLLSWRSESIVDEAKRQMGPSYRQGQILLYNPAKDARWEDHKGEIEALRKATLVQRNTFGQFTIEEPRLRYWLKEFDREYGLVGSRRWTSRAEKRFEGIGERLPEYWGEGYLYVSLRGSERKGNAPLQGGLADSTRERYLRIGRVLERHALENRPGYMAIRANEVSRQTWWVEHAVLRRQVRYLEEISIEKGRESLRHELFQLRRGIEAMDYKSLRTVARKQQVALNRRHVERTAIDRLLERARAKGDWELHDAIVVSDATGLRPAELQRGVILHKDGKNTRVDIRTAKKNTGSEDSRRRFQAEKGIDRQIAVENNSELEKIAGRHAGHFKPISSKDDLRMRLIELRKDLEGTENLSFYTLRHQFKDRLAEEGESPNSIARQMGHRSARSQESYGTR